MRLDNLYCNKRILFYFKSFKEEFDVRILYIRDSQTQNLR